MSLLNGLLYTTTYENLQSVKHSKSYDTQHKNPSKRSLFGYTAIKLEEDVTFHVGWRPDIMREYQAKKGEYLVQCPMQPPNIVKTWAELRTKHYVFQSNA